MLQSRVRLPKDSLSVQRWSRGWNHHRRITACSRKGARLYPYGDDFDGTACNGVGSGHREPVASSLGCVGGYDGLFDMTGNVAEWIDDCGDGGACAMMGGNFGFPQGSLHCGASDLQPGDAGYPQGGFRCCATPPAP